MSIKIYSEFDDFSFEEKDLLENLENTTFDDPYEDDTTDVFMYSGKENEFKEDSSFFVVCDSSDEELAQEIAEYLGKTTKIQLDDLHKVVFCVKWHISFQIVRNKSLKSHV